MIYIAGEKSLKDEGWGVEKKEGWNGKKEGSMTEGKERGKAKERP